MHEEIRLQSNPDTQHIRYRRDIDGLRALAVSAVILFHVDERLLPGGFAGVDIFFVISGFLITGNLVEVHEASRLSLAEFYRRRMKRILPALAVVVLATLAAGVLILLPEDLVALAHSALASMTFVANVFFDQTLDTSYFAAASNQVPLLHIWSLGVEEQFYMVWPLALAMSLSVLPGWRQRLALILLVTCASFVFAEVMLGSDASYAYYRMPPRVGELLLGAAAFLACRPGGDFLTSPALRNAVGLMALLVIIASLILVSGDYGFPGLSAIPATLATAVLIWAGARGQPWTSSLLSLRPVVWIGLASYSLYLWHWPILAYVRYVFGEVTPASALLSVGATGLLAALTLRYVEQPARAVSWRLGKIAVAYLAAPLVAVALAVLWIGATDGAGTLDHADLMAIRRLERQTANTSDFKYVCSAWRTEAASLEDRKCVLGGKSKDQIEPRILLFGDSNAAHYVGIIGEIAKRSDVAFRNVTTHACPPLLELPNGYGFPGHEDDCRRSLEVIADSLTPYELIILSGQWDIYARRPDFFGHLQQTVETLRRQGHRVVLLGQVPRMPDFDRLCSAKSVKLGFLDCRARERYQLALPLPFNEELRKLAANTPGVFYLDVTPDVCPDGMCSGYLGKQPIYYNGGHLSMKGSWAVGRRLVDRVGIPAFFRTGYLEDQSPG